MMYYSFLETKKGRLLVGMFLFVLLLLARDTLITSCLIGFYPSQLMAAGMICVLGILFLAANRKQLPQILRDKRMLAMVIAAVAILLPMVCKPDMQMMYCSVLLCIFFAVFLTFFMTLKEAARCYVLIMTALAVYSVFAVYAGRILADSAALKIPTFVNAGGREFYNFLFSFVSVSQVRFRNFGIFREPGVYQFFLILALLLHNYVICWDKSWKYWAINLILIVTALTTFSTNGVLETILLILVVFLDRKLYRNKNVLAAAVVSAVLLILGIIAILLMGGDLAFTLRQMLAKLYTLNRSSSARLDAIVADTRFFLQNPLFGERISVVLYAVPYNTTSTMLMFAMFGILGGGLHLVSWVALVWEKARKLWVNLALLLIMLMSFNTQNLIADTFFWLFPIMALAEKGLPLINRKIGEPPESSPGS